MYNDVFTARSADAAVATAADGPRGSGVKTRETRRTKTMDTRKKLRN
jgi:hypothetical protein